MLVNFKVYRNSMQLRIFLLISVLFVITCGEETERSKDDESIFYVY